MTQQAETPWAETPGAETARAETSHAPAAPRVAPAPDSVYDVAPALRRRREAAARVRVRRLLVADVGSGLAVALVGLLLAPGLAVSALGAILVVVGCAGWIALERRSRRREEMDQSRR